MIEVIGLEKLNQFFNGHSVGKRLKFQNIRCSKCGRSIDIEIQKTAAGYGFSNGILAEENGGKLTARCASCYPGR